MTGYASIDIQPGYQRLNGAQALDWVRYRHDQNGDFTRIVRQQIFLREMKRELAGSATLIEPAAVPGGDDHHLAQRDLRHLEPGQALHGAHPGPALNTNHIYQTHIDGSTPTINGVDYVVATPAAGARRGPSVPAPDQGAARLDERRRRAERLAGGRRGERGVGREALDGQARHHRLGLPRGPVARAAGARAI